VDSPTQLTLETSYAEDDATAQDFSHWPQVYSPAVGDVAEVRTVVYQTEMGQRPKEYFNLVDPERESTGTPLYWSVFSKSSALGIISLEIWPAGDTDYAITVFYKKKVSDLSADTDEPVFRAEVLEAGALWDCYRQAFGVTQNPAFIGMARDAQTEFQGLLRQMIIEDLSTSSLPRRIRPWNDTRGPWDSNVFSIDHDVEVW